MDSDRDAVNDGEVSPKEDSCLLPDIEIMQNHEILYGKDSTILDSKSKIVSVGNNAAIIEKLLEETNKESSSKKPAIESTEQMVPLIEVISEESHRNFMPVDTEITNCSDANTTNEKNSSIIFNCENLESLKCWSIEDDGTIENVVCSDGGDDSAKCLSLHEY